jgi:hypothetical protein
VSLRRAPLAFLAVALGCAVGPDPAQEAAGRGRYFAIEVVDGATGRGVPLVELETTNQVLYVTDSAGLAAVFEPELMGKEVYFHVRSHGYTLPADGFGYRGVRVRLEPGGSAQVRMQRLNVAERLYRVTGAGIFGDSVLLGRRPPLIEPLLNGGVLGQDSVVNAVLGGRLYWFWGDTNRAAYPLGNFRVSGAVSELPGRGGLEPDQGVDLRYWVNQEGFAREMFPFDAPGPVWVFGLMVLAEDSREELFAHYARMKSLGERHEHGIARWDASAERFVKEREFPLDAPLHPLGHPLRVLEDGAEWFLFPDPYPTVRVEARKQAIFAPERYEAFTCLRQGARWDPSRPEIERDGAGRAVWAWKRDTAAITPERWQHLVREGLLGDGQGPLQLRDVESGERIRGHGGTVFYNVHRGKWVMVALQSWGRSMLGEVWYAEGDTPLGPWTYARRIVTHDRYSFYNVAHHPQFDRARWIYFEGTYTAAFSGNERPTPRYDYNQVMYRLDLDDERLRLPAPVYRLRATAASGAPCLAMGARVEREHLWGEVEAVAFYALDPARAPAEALAVCAPPAEGRRCEVKREAAAGDDVLFRVLPPPAAAGSSGANDKAPLVLLYSWTKAGSSDEELRTESDSPGEGWQRGVAPLGRVWGSPSSAVFLLPGARPITTPLLTGTARSSSAAPARAGGRSGDAAAAELPLRGRGGSRGRPGR